ncbi:hypothetical protein [Draconibacterium sediminis]|uniref:hypothetical protein n=1 Tax=Draconibacterium sediminis TaxID=1544798 RepID=UPI0026E9A31F|nr:hypothetical protein [Draconibacterium sediminis]
MKTSTPILTLFLFALTLLISCDFEEEEADYDPTFITGYDNGFIDIITFGSGNGVSINLLDDSSSTSIGKAGFDVDKDSVVDFYLSDRYVKTEHGYWIMEAEISVSNSDFKISVIEITDTLYQCIDTAHNIIVIYTDNHYYPCDRNRLDSFFSAEINSYPKIYSAGDTLSHTEAWGSESMTLGYYDISSGIAPERSVVYGNWIGEFDKYILFKKEDDGSILYGWFKLTVFHDCQVTIYEYAIQKTNIE